MHNISTFVAGLCVVALVAALGSCPALATLTFSGSPTLSYNEPFQLYSFGQSAWCSLVETQGLTAINCAGGATQQQAVWLAISSPTGATGPIPMVNGPMGGIYLYNAAGADTWCKMLPLPVNSQSTIVCEYCNQTLSDSLFAFVNPNPVTTPGYLNVNGSNVNFRTSTDYYCSALPSSQNDGQVRCNAAAASSWESFGFILP